MPRPQTPCSQIFPDGAKRSMIVRRSPDRDPACRAAAVMSMPPSCGRGASSRAREPAGERSGDAVVLRASGADGYDSICTSKPAFVRCRPCCCPRESGTGRLRHRHRPGRAGGYSSSLPAVIRRAMWPGRRRRYRLPSPVSHTRGGVVGQAPAPAARSWGNSSMTRWRRAAER